MGFCQICDMDVISDRCSIFGGEILLRRILFNWISEDQKSKTQSSSTKTEDKKIALNSPSKLLNN